MSRRCTLSRARASTRSPLRPVYETVKKKEAERRRDESASQEPRFADVLKEQWEARKREMAMAEEAAAAAKSADG